MKPSYVYTLFLASSLAGAQPAATPPPNPSAGSPAEATPATATAPAQPEPEPAPPPAAPEPIAAQEPVPAAQPARVLDLAAIQALVDERIAAQPKTAGYEPGNGFYLRAGDGAAKLKLGGYTQFDGRLFYNETSAAQVDQFGFKSIRPELVGTVFDSYDLRLLPDFAGGKLVIQEAYVDVHYVDELEVRFGKTKVPFGLERLQPEVATTFTSRGLPSLLVPDRDLGVQVFGNLGKGLVQYQVAVVNGSIDGQSTDTDTSDHKELVARAFITPIAGGPGFGGGATYGIEHGTFAQTDLSSWTTPGGAPFFAFKTGTSVMDTPVADGLHWRATGHAAWYTGPFGAIAEYVRSQQHVGLGMNHGIVAAEAWQVVTQVVLAGGASTYKGVMPAKFDPQHGRFGAFDVAARFGEIRLTDTTAFDKGFADPTKSARKAFSGGLGVDWLPNRSFRFVLDFDRTWFTGGALGDDRAIETSVIARAQTVF